MKLITVTGYKGGCGKSTTAIHLATYFSDRGKTLLIDSDQNRTAVAWAKLGKLPFDVKDLKAKIFVRTSPTLLKKVSPSMFILVPQT